MECGIHTNNSQHGKRWKCSELIPDYNTHDYLEWGIIMADWHFMFPKLAVLNQKKESMPQPSHLYDVLWIYHSYDNSKKRNDSAICDEPMTRHSRSIVGHVDPLRCKSIVLRWD